MKVGALAAQLDYLEAAPPFYRERIRGRRDLAGIPFTTKAELRESQQRDPPFGEHLCAPREALVRLHVTSGTTGEPVAIGLTQRDHEANSKVGGQAFRIAGLRPDDTVAHCLNYALYAGGIADHMAIEASGATVVPVGVGQSRRLLELIDPETGEALPLEDGAAGELVWTHLAREASPLLRYRSSDLATVYTAPCACGRASPRIRIGGRRDDMLRLQAVNVYPQAIGEVLDRLGASGGYAVVADGDPIATPLHVYVESPDDLDRLEQELRAALRTDVALTALARGELPVAEHKTVRVFRTARGDALPDAIRRHREAP